MSNRALALLDQVQALPPDERGQLYEMLAPRLASLRPLASAEAAPLPHASPEPARRAPVLKGQRATLRPPREGDKRDRLACGRSPELVRMYGGDYRSVAPLTSEEVERWHEQVSDSSGRGSSARARSSPASGTAT